MVMVTSESFIIFSDNKNEVDDIQEYLLLKGVEAVAIHGSKCMWLSLLECGARMLTSS